MKVCPWCEMEIYGESELGEDSKRCPHCENDLGDYRIVNLDLGMDEEEDEDVLTEANPQTETEEAVEVYFGPFEQVVRNIQDAHDETWECSNCEEMMIQVSEHTVESSNWNPITLSGWNQPLLSAPFQVTSWICPGCFRMEQALSEKDRKQLMLEWSNQASK